ncbi:MAG: hypothetical protein GY898_27080 [Proteobacteria bacterium]|nr:hypothetical protein [Pseudomonadota bacterium]
MRSGPTHGGLLLLLAVHAALYAWIVGSASPWATAPLECAPGAMAELMLDGSDWSIWDTFHGALGGMFVSASAGLPLLAALGVKAGTLKLLAWLTAVVVIGVVYALLDRHESRTAALLGATGIAFGPPALFHVQAVFGNWHWTQLFFDYGVVLLALELARQPRPAWAWGLFGFATGVGIFNCIGSLPFMAVGWLALLVAAGARGVAPKLGAAVGGAVVGGAPFLYKLLIHRPFGLPESPGDQTLGRLSRLSVEPSKALDLVYPELPWALHIHDALPTWSGQVTWRIETAWVVITWLGLGAAVVFGVGLWKTNRRHLPVALVPALFALLFAGAYVVLDTKLRMLPLDFTNVREASHRTIPPLLAALAVGSGIGWARLAERWPRVRGVMLALGALPAVIGAGTMLALVPADAPASVSTVSSYRAVCFDALGHFAAGAFRGDPAAGHEVCEGLRDPARAASCQRGVAWGTGFFGGRLGAVADADRPVDFEPGAIGFTAEGRAVCDSLPDGSRADCLLGVGWSAGASNWGVGPWPLKACDSFADEADRAGCWRGVGFPVGDHLHPTPAKAVGLLGRVPQDRRALVAEGMGLAIARSYGTPAMANWLCDRIGGRDAAACRRGVADWHR